MIYLGSTQLSIGARGADGKSAYAAAVEGGYTGSETEYNTLVANFLGKTNPIITGTVTKNTSNVAGEQYSATMPSGQVAGDYWFEPIVAVNA